MLFADAFLSKQLEIQLLVLAKLSYEDVGVDEVRCYFFCGLIALRNPNDLI